MSVEKFITKLSRAVRRIADELWGGRIAFVFLLTFNYYYNGLAKKSFLVNPQ